VVVSFLIQQGTIPKNPPITLDSKRKLQDPFNLDTWIKDNRSALDEKGCINLFGNSYQFQVSLVFHHHSFHLNYFLKTISFYNLLFHKVIEFKENNYSIRK